jgi:hypothetical protein
VREYYDDGDERFHVDLEVHDRWFGFLFGYADAFQCEWMPAADPPARLKPPARSAHLRGATAGTLSRQARHPTRFVALAPATRAAGRPARCVSPRRG